ncbi:hypothetical protein BK049_11695 [Bacillus xiamenensis]|uniref:Uncharacterized protein n=1 Tax=Bacillus xiamenensis TaxID=1178537 RepID=A0AAC9ND07_9BACI|nr:hypothetical protein [Bacillus xiamenensis]AOZ89289.1 hypothetical protein BK049_11695 [Bacillus xiamenensis]
MDKTIQEKIDNTISNLNGKEEEIDGWKQRYDDLLAIQEQATKEVLEKLTPVFQYMANKNVSFFNKTFNLSSHVGPVIGFDKKENTKYVIRQDRYIDEYNVYTNEIVKENIELKSFLRANSFDILYGSLIDQLDFQNKIMKQYQEKIDQAELDLIKYGIPH